MLPRPLRVTRPPEHRELARHGARAGTATLVVHLLNASRAATGAEGGTPAPDPSVTGRTVGSARAGVVVGRPVGDAVTRHRVARRLRHLLGPRLTALEPGTALVVRARLPAAAASSGVLGADLDAALGRLTRSGSARRRSRPSGSVGPRGPAAASASAPVDDPVSR